MKTDTPLKVLFRKYAQDLLGLLGDAGASLLAVENVEIQQLERRVDGLLKLERQGEVYYRHVEFQAEDAPDVARRCFLCRARHKKHSTAVGLLQAGVDRAVIALWLGHESVETTQMYLDADLAMKERALARVAPLHVSPKRFRPRDRLLAFLEGL